MGVGGLLAQVLPVTTVIAAFGLITMGAGPGRSARPGRPRRMTGGAGFGYTVARVPVAESSAARQE